MKRYDKEFKEQALLLSDEIGVKKTSEQLGVLYCTLAEWRKQRTRKTIIRPKDTKESNDEVTRLIKENAELKKANSILKDAGVTTIVEANVFLEKYIEKFNAQFAICEGVKSCRVNISQEQIDYALVTIAKRTVDCGNGIRLNNKYYGTFDSYGNQIYIKPKTKVSVITMMNGSVFALHDNRILVLDIIPERQKISEQIDFDMEKLVVRKKYIPPFDSIWRITNANLFRKKALTF